MLSRSNVVVATTIAIVLAGCRDRSESRDPQAITSANVLPANPSASVKPAESPSMTRVDPPAGASAEAPNLFVSTNGVFLTWIESVQGKPSIRLAQFSQGHWTNATTVVTTKNLLVNWSDVPAVAEAGGRIFVAFPEHQKDHQGYRAEVAVSIDGGKTFQRRGPLHADTSDTEHGFVAFVPDKADAVRAFWLDGRAMANAPPNGPYPPMRLYTALLGEGITDEVLLDERTCDCCGLGVGRSDQGPLVAYRDRKDNEVRDIAVVHAEGQGFSRPFTVHDDGYRIAGCPVNGPAVAADGSRVAITWYTYASEIGRVKVAFSSDGAAHFSEPITLDDSNGSVAPLGRVSIAWVDQGDAVALYVEAERERARLVLRRVNPNGSLFAKFVVADTRSERKSGFPKMVRLDDQLLIAWTDAESPSHVHATLVPLASVPRQTMNVANGTRNDQHSLREGDRMPVFDVQTLDGKSVSLQSFTGKPVLVNLWASYCEPCRQELPVLAKLHKKYKKRGLEMVGMAMDERATATTLQKIVKKRGVEYPIWLDPGDQAGRAFGVRVLPATFLIDRKGTIVLIRKGAVHDDDTDLEKSIEKVLERERP